MSLTLEHVLTSLAQVSGFVLAVILGIIVLELLLWVMLYRRPRNTLSRVVILVIDLWFLLGVGFYVFFYEVIGFGTDIVVAFNKLLNLPGDLLYAWTGLDIIPLIHLDKLPWPWLWILAIFVVAWAVLYVLSKPKPVRNEMAYLLVAPAVVGILALFIYPFLFEIRLSFANLVLTTFKDYRQHDALTLFSTYGVSLAYGVKNYKGVFTGSVAKSATFWQVLGWNVVWTVVNVTLHVTVGMALALLMNRKLRLRGLYRTLLVIPWAIPQVIAAMAWKQEFNFHYGFINNVLELLGFQAINWLQDPFHARLAVIIVNVWLGIPFMMVIILGGLQSIDKALYEAAEIDGAGAFAQFRNVTWPSLKPVITPAVILGTVWTFNMFNVIWLVTQGGPQEKTDLLVTSLYKSFVNFYRYSHAAAFGMVIFLMLLSFTVVYLKVTGGLKSIYE